jgi:hypothetical protein
MTEKEEQLKKTSDYKMTEKEDLIKNIYVKYDNKTLTIKEYSTESEMQTIKENDQQFTYKEWIEENYD